MTQLGELLRTLAVAKVDFILVGGVAAAAHGSPRATQDVDIVYRRTPENISKLIDALGPLRPYLRGAPPGLPFRLDEPTIKAGLNFTLVTDLGWIDLLGEITGGGSYEDLIEHSLEIPVFNVRCRVLDLATLIRTKKAAGRPKDFEAVAELEVLQQRARG